jgi:hypothetical protein
MKLPSVLSTTAAALLLGNASAFSGQMAAGEYTLSAQLGYGQSITLTDYYTGSQYYAWLYGGFNACVNNKCTVQYVYMPSLPRELQSVPGWWLPTAEERGDSLLPACPHLPYRDTSNSDKRKKANDLLDIWLTVHD